MNKNKFYISVIIGLLLSNLLLVSFFIFMPKHEKRIDPDRPRNIIIERLQFDEQQIREYDELIKEHRIQIREKDRQMIQLKNSLYGLLYSSENIELKTDSLIKELGKTQQQIEQIHFNHFMDIKRLCKPEQLPEFDRLAKDISGIFAPPRRQRQ